MAHEAGNELLSSDGLVVAYLQYCRLSGGVIENKPCVFDRPGAPKQHGWKLPVLGQLRDIAEEGLECFLCNPQSRFIEAIDQESYAVLVPSLYEV